MKIAVIGYCGAGKSTLARALGERYGIPVLHFDRVSGKNGSGIYAVDFVEAAHQ